MKTFCLEVTGDFACFTRPEMKVERVSYDVITPSAARAVFEAILWKPAIRWQVTKIEVLKPIKWITLRRNEIGAVVSSRNVQTAMNSGSGDLVFTSRMNASSALDCFYAMSPTVFMQGLNYATSQNINQIFHIFPNIASTMPTNNVLLMKQTPPQNS